MTFPRKSRSGGESEGVATSSGTGRLAALGGRGQWPMAALLAVATLLVYAGVAGHEFLYFDDDQYVTHNVWVRGGLTWAGLRWAFATFHFANWHPLTWLSHMMDVQVFGLNASAHHLVNALLHASNAGLLFLVLAGMTGARGRSVFVAALFAFHPLHVESVAWIAERKDLLSTFFGLLMMGSYLHHAKQPRARRLAAVALCLALSLLSKPMWVTAPFLLLLLDYWPLVRTEGQALQPFSAGLELPHLPLKRLLAEKVPLLALSVVSCIVTLMAQSRGGALVPVEVVGFGDRVANASASYATYLGKTFWPVALSPFYPRVAAGTPLWQTAAVGVLLLTVTVLALLRLHRAPWLAVGWFWFLGTLVPVIGLVQAGEQAMADRYTYVPIIGLFIAVVWEGQRLAGRLSGPTRRALPVAIFGVVAVLCALTWRQIGYWRDQETLFRHATVVTEKNGRAHLILAQALAEKGNFAEALLHGSEAARLDPNNPRAHKNLGFVLYRLGRIDEAIGAFQTAIALKPDYAEAHGNLGIAYGKKGWIEAAMREMRLEAEMRAVQSRR